MRYRARAWRRTHRAASALLAIAVALTGGLVLALVGGAARTASAPDRFTAAHPGADFDVTIEQGEGAPRLEELRALPALDRVEMATFVFGGLVQEGNPAPLESLVFAGSPTAVGGEVREGREPSEPTEFAVTPSFLEVSGAALGDQFTLLTISGEQAAEFGFDVPEPAGPTLDRHPGRRHRAARQRPRRRVADRGVPRDPPRRGRHRHRGQPGHRRPGAGGEPRRPPRPAQRPPGRRGVRHRVGRGGGRGGAGGGGGAGPGLAVLAAIVALAAVVVLTQVLSRQLRPTTAEDEVLRAVGLPRRQVLLEPVGRAVVPVAVGTVGAAIVAIVASRAFPSGFARRVEPDPGIRVDGLVHVVGALAFGVGLLALVAVLRRGTGAGAAESDAPRAVDRLASWAPSPRAGIGVRFAFGRDGRTGSVAAPLAGVVAVVALVAAALTFGASLDRLIDEPARYGERYDLGIGAGGGVLPDGVVDALDASPAVAGLAQYMATTVQVGSDALGLIGMDIRKGDLAPEVLEGHLPQAPDELALGSRAARDLHVDVGDVVTLRGPGGERRAARERRRHPPGRRGGRADRPDRRGDPGGHARAWRPTSR